MNDMKGQLINSGFEKQVKMAGYVNAIDERLGGGSANREKGGLSWGEITLDDWTNDPGLEYVSEGDKENVLAEYARLRGKGVQGWLSITTNNWMIFKLWRPI